MIRAGERLAGNEQDHGLAGQRGQGDWRPRTSGRSKTLPTPTLDVVGGHPLSTPLTSAFPTCSAGPILIKSKPAENNARTLSGQNSMESQTLIAAVMGIQSSSQG